ncbi:hypothetical protein NDU88_002997 [Pleurodeles waltl]|uniref:Uncharacterized protein n=1 Tax=Pleurodeles waltl TaxID=8319 RepID=A0AAV7QAG3_PLEWA|nr:hypothetical protein NDU88_002997 [Pleurodeles waltl]
MLALHNPLERCLALCALHAGRSSARPAWGEAILPAAWWSGMPPPPVNHSRRPRSYLFGRRIGPLALDSRGAGSAAAFRPQAPWVRRLVWRSLCFRPQGGTWPCMRLVFWCPAGGVPLTASAGRRPPEGDVWSFCGWMPWGAPAVEACGA